MATSVRGGANGGKEKRGTSPSSILKKSSKPSSSSNQNSSSSSLNDEKTSSPTETSSKPVPNYLKPTMSSSLDFSRLPKKSGSDTSAQKPGHHRRRSFDRPPPSAQVQRAVRGPSGGPRDIKPQRSTSFSNKSSSPSVRPASEKLFARTSSLKDKKVEGPSLTRSKSVKKSTLSSTSARKEPTSSSSASSAKKAPRSVTSESSVDYENPSSVDHVAIEEDDLVNLDDHEVQSLPEMSEMPDGNQELADPTNFEVDIVKHLEEESKESTLKEDHHFDHEDKSTLVDDQVALKEAVEDQENGNIDNHQTVEQVSADDDQQKAEAAGEQNLVEGAEDQKDDAEKMVSEVEPTEAVVEEKKEDDKEEEEEEEEKKVTEPEKRDQQESEGKEEKQTDSSPSAEAAAPEKSQSSPGQKDKQAYNDVIEETATKLRGKKNKVLALAGAFETVISLDKS